MAVGTSRVGTGACTLHTNEHLHQLPIPNKTAFPPPDLPKPLPPLPAAIVVRVRTGSHAGRWLPHPLRRLGAPPPRRAPSAPRSWLRVHERIVQLPPSPPAALRQPACCPPHLCERPLASDPPPLVASFGRGHDSGRRPWRSRASHPLGTRAKATARCPCCPAA